MTAGYPWITSCGQGVGTPRLFSSPTVTDIDFWLRFLASHEIDFWPPLAHLREKSTFGLLSRGIDFWPLPHASREIDFCPHMKSTFSLLSHTSKENRLLASPHLLPKFLAVHR